MKVRYIGVHDAVEVDAWGVYVEHGGEVDVTDEQGCTALEQTDAWEPADDESAATFAEFLQWVADVRVGLAAAEAAHELVDETVRQHVQEAKANGSPLTPVEQVELWNHQMLNAAADAEGAARRAILDHVARANGVPPESVTLDVVDAGVDAAESSLNAASAVRTAAVQVDEAKPVTDEQLGLAGDTPPPAIPPESPAPETKPRRGAKHDDAAKPAESDGE